MSDFFRFVWQFFADLDFERHTGITFLVLICGLCWLLPFDAALPIVIVLGPASAWCLMSRQIPGEPLDKDKP